MGSEVAGGLSKRNTEKIILPVVKLRLELIYVGFLVVCLREEF